MKCTDTKTSLILVWMRLVFLFFFLFSGIIGCGDKNATSNLFEFKLSETVTSKEKVTLSFETFGGSFLYSITGEGFTASESLGESHPIKGQVTLYFKEFRDYTLNLKIYQSDGTEFLSQDISWTRSNMIPNDPVVSFSESATSDALVKLLIVPNLDPLTDEIWVEGDLAKDPKGVWAPIPDIYKLNLVLSSEDGIKEIRVKYRNQMGNESQMVTLYITKNSQSPEECQSTALAEFTNSSTVKFKISGKDDQKLFYRISGDVKGGLDFTEFTESTIVKAELVLSDKTTVIKKRVVVQIKDEADNFCTPMEHFVTFDPNYQPFSVSEVNNALWSDSEGVTVTLHYDHFAEESVEVYLDGGVQESDTTFQWIPLADQVTVNLTPSEGNRFIYAKFREVSTPDVVTRSVYTAVYLRPHAYYIKRTSLPDRIALAQIVGLTGITITGCQEAYSNIASTSMVDCTPTSSQVTVIYSLNDGTQVQKILSTN